MGMFDGKEKKILEEKFHKIDVMEHQIMDLMALLKKVNERQDKIEKDIGDAHQALGILDNDFLISRILLSAKKGRLSRG